VDPRSDEQLQEIVEGFVLRARRVLAHSLASDETSLEVLAAGAWMAVRVDGVVNLERRLPNEEALESLAARVRPLTLQRDPVRYDYVLKALKSLLIRRNEPRHADWCKELKADWRSVDPAEGQATYFLSSWVKDGAEPPEDITDAALALTWFYGDLVHADKQQVDVGAKFGIDQRFAAAAVRTAQLVILTRDTLSFVRFLVEEGVISLGSAALEATEVRVTSKTVELTGIYQGPGDAVPPKAGGPFGDAWHKMEGPWLGDEDGRWLIRIPWGRSDD
jgi:hypothetical protein